ncbi:hypothetical protein [uncultured Methylobacterium sp.]|jgi:hypothetical protein|uniref:hypothetical protein n=1 Tax=uncultured Methylobacterium sp. TaxID=157278 RepID=UPI002631F83B|nr:hypothetical protein [uncultured Methylobacterium sp.]
MIKLVLFDKIGGFSCRYPQDPDGYEHDLKRIEDLVPIANQEAMLPSGSDGLYIVSRCRRSAAWTWIGSYKPVPRHLLTREGDFFGAGVWLANCVLPGQRIHHALEAATSNMQSLMESAQAWRLDYVDSGALSDSRRAVEELLPYPTPLYEGEGLNFDLVAATGSYEYSEASRPQDIVEAIDRAQTGSGVDWLSRVIIPRDVRASRNVRIQGTRLRRDVKAAPARRSPVRQTSVAPASAPDPPKPANAVRDRAAMRNRESQSSTYADIEPMLTRRQKLVEERVSQIEAGLQGLHRSIKLTAAAVATAVVVSSLPLALRFIDDQQKPIDTGLRTRTTQDAVREPVDVTAGPLPTLSIEAGKNQSGEGRPTSGGDGGDPYGRFETSLLATASQLDAGPLLSSDDARRRVTRAFHGLIDALQQSPDPKLKAIADKARAAFPEQSRPKTRN